MPDEPKRAPDAQPELIPLEAHIIALRAELERTQLTLRIATGALLGVALLLLWGQVRGSSPRLGAS